MEIMPQGGILRSPVVELLGQGWGVFELGQGATLCRVLEDPDSLWLNLRGLVLTSWLRSHARKGVR